MHQLNPKPYPQRWREKFTRSTYFVAAVLFHLVLFLMVATFVVFKAPEPPHDAEFHQAAMVKIQPPPPQPPATGDAAQNPQFEPQTVVVPVVTPPSVITTTSSPFEVDASKAVNQAVSHLTDQMAQGAGMTAGGGGNGRGNGNALFGSFTGSDTELQGTVYDLKIDPKHKNTNMNQDAYTRVLHDFVAKGWDENVLAPFYKASKKLYTPTIWIPTTPTPATATAMNLENELTPRFWVGWYHARITPSQAGTYHFVGFGDDILVVAINGNLVLDGSLWPVTPGLQKMPWPYDSWSRMCRFRGQNYGKLRVGDNFEVNTIEPVTIDILMGDEPGGYYNAFLMIAKNGKDYPMGPEGVPLYPIFQIGSEPLVRPGDQVPHQAKPEAWAAP